MRAYRDFLGLKLTSGDSAKLAALLAASGLTRSAFIRELVRRTSGAATATAAEAGSAG